MLNEKQARLTPANCFYIQQDIEPLEKRKNEYLQKIRKKLLSGDKNGLQHNVILYCNLKFFLDSQNNDEIKNYFYKLYLKNISYLGTSEKDFINSLPNEYNQNIFELVMAEFISKKFKLNKRNNKIGVSDIEFDHDGITYFLECTSRTTSKIDQYCEFTIDFNSYYTAAEVVFNKAQRLKRECWYQYIPMNLTNEEKLKIKTIFGLNANITTDSAIEKLENWINITQYVSCYFSEFMLPEVIKKLKAIDFPLYTYPKRKNVLQEDREFLVKCIAQLILDKLEKSYHKTTTPVIVAISLNSLFESLHANTFSPFITDIEKILPNKLKEIANEKANKKQKKIECYRNSLSNLYAILIDTYYYNWIPEIAKKKFNACMPENGNFYTVIYNSNSSHFKQKNIKIFDSLAYANISIGLDL